MIPLNKSELIQQAKWTLGISRESERRAETNEDAFGYATSRANLAEIYYLVKGHMEGPLVGSND